MKDNALKEDKCTTYRETVCNIHHLQGNLTLSLFFCFFVFYPF